MFLHMIKIEGTRILIYSNCISLRLYLENNQMEQKNDSKTGDYQEREFEFNNTHTALFAVGTAVLMACLKRAILHVCIYEISFQFVPKITLYMLSCTIFLAIIR